MNKLISSTLLTVVAVPFLMAAPAAKKAQNGTTAAPAAKKVQKKHSTKKSKAPVAAATDAKK